MYLLCVVPEPPAVIITGSSCEAQCWIALTVSTVPPTLMSAGRIAVGTTVHTLPLQTTFSREVCWVVL